MLLLFYLIFMTFGKTFSRRQPHVACLASFWFFLWSILIQVKGVEQELDAEDEDAALASQME